MKKTVVKISLWSFFGILVVLGGLYVWLFYTNSGLRWSLGEIRHATKEFIDYGTVKGAWLTKVEFDHLNVNASPVMIQSKHTRFHLSLRRILSGKLEVVSFQAADLNIRYEAVSSAPSEKKTGKGGFALPLSVLIHSLSIDKLSYQQHDQSPLVFNNVKARNSSIREQIDIGRISAQTSYGSADVHGWIIPAANGKLNLDAKFVLNATKDFPQVKGSANISGAFDELSLHGKVVQPYEIDANASLNSTQPTTTWSLAVNATKVPLQTSFKQLPFTLSNVKLNAGGNFNDYFIKGISTIAIENKGLWDANFNVAKTTSQWKIDRLDLNNRTTNTMFSINGTVTTGFSFDSTTPFALQANWENAQWPLIDKAVVASKSGSLQAEGSMKNYRLTSTGAFRWSDKEITNLDLVADGSFNKLVFSHIAGDYNKGHIDGSGTVEIGAEPSWQARAKLSRLDLSGFYSGLKTNLSASVGIEGAYVQDKLSGSFSIKDLKGTVHKKPVTGKARIAIDGKNIQVSSLALRSGKNVLSGKLDYLSETVTEPGRINATWDLKMQDLSLVQPTLKGRLNSKGSVSGQLDKLVGNTSVDATDILYEKYKINKFAIDTAFDFSDKTSSHFLLTMDQGLFAGIPLDAVRVDIKGKLARQSINAKVVGNRDNVVTLKGVGSWKQNQWVFNWDSTQWDSKHFGNWRQKQAVNVLVSATELKMQHYCLQKNQQTGFCGSVNAQNYQQWNGKLTFTKIPLEMFNPYLPPQFASTAVDLNGKGSFRYAPSTGAIVDFNASGENGTISGIKVEGQETQIKFSQFSFDVSNKEEKLQAKTSVDFGKTGNVHLALSFPGWSQLGIPDLNQKMNGKVVVNLNNLSLLTIVSNQIKEPVGQWHSDISIGGTLGAPVLLGTSKLQASSLTITRLGLKLRDVEFFAKTNEKRVVSVTGSAKSGKGSINITGSLNDYRAATPTGMIKISGKNFEMAHTPEATVIGSPDLDLSLNQGALNITGDVTISEADLKIFTPVTTIAPSPDVVIVSQKEPQTTAQSALKLKSKIRIILGKKVKIQGYGFTGRVEGSVLVDDTHELPTASGEIKIVDGKFAAYGTELDISDGRLSFTGGAIDNPLVDVRAERHPDDVTVGLAVEGTAKSPKIRLFSEPAMDDSDILSYIILGTPTSGASKEQGQLLANAAASLGLLGGEKLAKKIGERFGIDEIKLQTDQTTQDTSLLLGKYLSPDFFIGYAIGIGNAVNTLQIQYKLTDQWMLKTQSGQSQKAEILFSIEKD